MKVALDTNILAHAEGVNGAARRNAALDLVQRLPAEVAIIPVQVLGELFNVLVRKAGRTRAEARDALLKLLGHVGEAADGLDQAARIEQESQQVGQVQPRPRDGDGPEHDDGGGDQRADRLHTLGQPRLAAVSFHTAVQEVSVLPLEAGLDDIPALPVTPEQARLLRHGQPLFGIPATGLHLATDGGMPVALVEASDGGLRVVRGFNL